MCCYWLLVHLNFLIGTTINYTLWLFEDFKFIFQYNTEDGRPLAVCYICYHMLKKCHRFTQSAIKAGEVLQQICKNGIQVMGYLRKKEKYLFDTTNKITILYILRV